MNIYLEKIQVTFEGENSFSINVFEDSAKTKQLKEIFGFPDTTSDATIIATVTTKLINSGYEVESCTLL